MAQRKSKSKSRSKSRPKPKAVARAIAEAAADAKAKAVPPPEVKEVITSVTRPPHIPTDPGVLIGILDDEDIRIIREGYSESGLLEVAAAGVVKYSAWVAPWVSWLEHVLYNVHRMAPVDRERCLVAYFVSHPTQQMPLGVHIYWGIAAGLSVEDIVQTLMLVGCYSGIGNFTLSGEVAEITLNTMKAQVDAGDAGYVAVLTALLAAFSA